MKNFLFQIRYDFSKETLMNFISKNYYVHLILGTATALWLSYLLLHSYKGEGISPYILVPMHAAITYMVCWGLGVLIEIFQDSKDSIEAGIDVRYTSYGFIPGNLLALLFYFHGQHNWTMLASAAVMYAAGYLLWKYNR